MLKDLFNRHGDADPSLKNLRSLSGRIPLLAYLSDADRDRLARLAQDFLRRKAVEGAAGLAVEPRMREIVALQAALPVLQLGLDLYTGWHAVILYRDEFVAPYEYQDPDGLVHQGSRDLSGESWQRGPVILSWARVEEDAFDAEPAGNLVIHELAHKLDMLNGAANGMPPLHRDMSPDDWAGVMSAAYEHLNRRLEGDSEPPIDPYAAESPAEFFAVVTELFFVWPESLAAAYPEVYTQLRRYFAQDPLAA